MSGVQHGFSLSGSCVRSIVTEESIISGPNAHERSVKETKVVRRSFSRFWESCRELFEWRRYRFGKRNGDWAVVAEKYPLSA